MRRAAGAILAKDLRVELRTWESVPAMVLFAVTAFVVFRFALDESRLEGNLAAGVLVATVLFAAILGVTRLFAAEREQRGLDAILLAPIDRDALLVAKAAGLWIYLAALELVALPVFAVFFLETWAALPTLFGVLALANAGIAVTGTLVASMTIGSRARELLIPLMLLPLLIPLVIATAGAAEPLLASGGPEFERIGTWLAVLGLYDVVFALLAYAVFDFLVED